MLFVLQDGLLFYQSYGSSHHLALLNISLPLVCTEWLHCKEQENSILENKEIDVGFYFFPQRCGELGFQRSGAFLSCRNLRHSWCKHLCQPAGPGAFICSPTSSAPPSCQLLCQAQLGTERLPPKPSPVLEETVPAAQCTMLAASAWHGPPGNANTKGCQLLAAKLRCCFQLRAV